MKNYALIDPMKYDPPLTWDRPLTYREHVDFVLKQVAFSVGIPSSLIKEERKDATD